VTAAGPGPVIPDFGHGSACVTGDHLFCWEWVRQHWGDTLEPHLVQHVELTLISVSIGFVLALTLALVSHRVRALDQPIAIAAGLIYTIPSLVAFQILIAFSGLSTTTVVIPLVGYSLVILYPNIVAGLRAAPPDVLEAARGMGLRRRQVLLRVELPLALPAIIAGLRIAVVSTVSIATIAAFLGEQGLGYPIFQALKEPTPFKTEIYSAGALVVALALAFDLLLVLARRLLVPWTRART
jgi:osmoprotectant transport system permease protein